MRRTGCTQLLLILVLAALAGCTIAPENIKPVTGFDVERYLGRWYEVARLDHSFEEGLTNVTADYSLREDGGLDVVNRGYSVDEGEWKAADGRAYLVDGRDKGHLKVSFFGPFYSAYVVFGLPGGSYEHAFVAGHDRSYLWFLSRTPSPAQSVKEEFLNQAKQLGFATDQLIWVEHDQSNN